MVAAVQLTRLAGKRVARHVGVALAAEVIVGTNVLVVVTGLVGFDECSVQIPARVSRRRAGLIQVTFVVYSVPEQKYNTNFWL